MKPDSCFGNLVLALENELERLQGLGLDIQTCRNVGSGARILVYIKSLLKHMVKYNSEIRNSWMFSS